MRFSLIPRELKFFDMFDVFAAQVTQAASRFHQMLTAFDKLDIRSRELNRDEEACDASVEKIIRALDRTFITPFDREDIHTLATSLDDIMAWFDGPDREQVKAVVEFAARNPGKPSEGAR